MVVVEIGVALIMCNQMVADKAVLSGKQQVFILFVLMILVVGLRAWQITHTEVAARDSIGFIRYAWLLENSDDWNAVIKDAQQHPGFPLAIHLVSKPVRYFVGSDLPFAYQLSSQLVSSFFSVLLVLPLFYLAFEIFNIKVAIWSVLLFEFLPAISKVLGDGLSEGMFLFFASCALACILVAFKTGRLTTWFLAGLFSACAYLVRPEGMIIVFACFVVMLGNILLGKFNDSKSKMKMVTGLAGVMLGFLMLALPFMMTIGKLTTKPTGQKILEKIAVLPMETDNRLALLDAPELMVGIFDQAPLFASWWEGEDKSPTARLMWSFMVLGDSYLKGLNYLGCAFALVGMFMMPRDRWLKPGVLVVVLTFFVLNVAFYRVALVMGYLSERHAMLALMLVVVWTAYGGVVLGDVVVLFFKESWLRGVLNRMNNVSVLLILLLMPSVYKSMETLHYNREGFKQVGKWLAINCKEGDSVEDAFCWSHFYAGKVFLEGKSDLVASNPRVKYVVVERSSNPHLRLQTQDEESLKAQKGKVVYDWPCRRKGVNSTVLVYEVPES
ncbi:MAG: hypothetical protein EBQ87_06315 [Planctomycetes bacterium]|nr:hypothetical protein [Planctomycetota bacterium]